MELVYFWTEKYKNLKNFSTTLNPQYQEPEKPILKNNKLYINLTKKDSQNIFNKNINVLTIVGQNGSGKSNLINLISTILRLDLKNNEKQEIFYYDKHNLPDKYCLIFEQDNILYTKNNLGLEVLINLGENNVYKPEQNYTKYHVAKFQPFLRLSEEAFNNTIIYEADKDIEYKINNYFYYDRFNNQSIIKSMDILFEYEDLKLFQENPNLKFDKLGFELNLINKIEDLNESLINIRNKIYKSKNLTQLTNQNLITKVNFTMRAYKRDIKALINKRTPKELLYRFAERYFPILCFENVLIKILQTAYNHHFSNLLDFIIIYILPKYDEPSINYKDKSERIRFYEEALQYINYDIKYSNLDVYNYPSFSLFDFVNTILNFEVNDENDFLKENFEAIIEYNEIRIRIKEPLMLNTEDTHLSFKTHSYEKKILFNENSIYPQLFDLNYFKYSNTDKAPYTFNNLSTGEQRILKFFSDIIQIENESIYSKNNYTPVCTYIFDEMDLSWHPEWQRKMVYYIMDLFSKSGRKINIIFTTHSPLILSDMPEDNVLLIRKNEYDNSAEIVKNKIATFGANIHDLFNNNFFLNCDYGCTIGEFAKSKIKEISDELKKLENLNDIKNYDNIPNLEAKINLIGEPIIRNAFLKKLYSLPGYINKNKTYEELYEEIINLKRKLNEKDR